MTASNAHPGLPGNANAQLLGWRLLFALVLASTALMLRHLALLELFGTGMIVGCGVLAAGLLAPWLGLGLRLDERQLLVLQLGLDTLGIGTLIHFTGGLGSPYALFWCVPVLLAGYYLGGRWSLAFGVVAAVATTGGHFAYASGWLPDLTGRFAADGIGQPLLATVLQSGLFVLMGRLSGLQASRSASGRRLRQQATAQMQKARSEVRNILDNINSGMLVLDAQGNITRANPAAEVILGISVEDVIGQSLVPALGPAKAVFTECIQRVVEGGAPLARYDTEIQRDGKDVPLGLSVSHIEDSQGDITGAIAIFKDLTEVKWMRERMREADRLAGVGELAASIAHEIRNPLGSIRGSVEILASELELSGHQDKLLKLILKESARVNTIINDFLSFARLRPPSQRLINCNEFIDEVALQIRQHIGVHGDQVSLSHQVKPQGMQIFVDPEQLTQLFLNLAINACESMGYCGELKITAEQAGDAEYCELRVMDSGPGISPAVTEDLFKPFVTTKKNGTGLGLPMVARIAHAHDGSVSAGRSPLGGAMFCVRLHLRAPKEQSESGFAPASAAVRQVQEKRTAPAGVS